MGEAREQQREVRALGRGLRRVVPGTYRAYAQLHGAALEHGVLSTATKELIALAIAVTRECDGCITAHADGAARSGATAEEVAEALGVAILMNGGPATVFGPRAFAAFREFAVATPPRETPPRTGHAGNAELARLLHDLDVANDFHPHRAAPATTADAGRGAQTQP